MNNEFKYTEGWGLYRSIEKNKKPSIKSIELYQQPSIPSEPEKYGIRHQLTLTDFSVNNRPQIPNMENARLVGIVTYHPSKTILLKYD